MRSRAQDEPNAISGSEQSIPQTFKIIQVYNLDFLSTHIWASCCFLLDPRYRLFSTEDPTHLSNLMSKCHFGGCKQRCLLCGHNYACVPGKELLEERMTDRAPSKTAL